VGKVTFPAAKRDARGAWRCPTTRLEDDHRDILRLNKIIRQATDGFKPGAGRSVRFSRTEVWQEPHHSINSRLRCKAERWPL